MDQQGHLLSLAIEIAEKRKRLLGAMKSALLNGQKERVLVLARELCGLTEPKEPSHEN